MFMVTKSLHQHGHSSMKCSEIQATFNAAASWESSTNSYRQK